MKARSLTYHTHRSAVLLIAVLFTSCTVGDTSSLMKDLETANAGRLRQKYGNADSLRAAIEAAERDSTGYKRNILLNDLILLIDVNYDHWEKLIYSKKAGFDLTSDAVLLGLGGATALTGTTSVANVLGQITTGVTGFKTSVDSDLLQKNTIPALVAKMRAARATQLTKIQAAMIELRDHEPIGPTPLSKYSVEQGLIDVNAYYAAGTFVTALQDITAKAGEEEKAAKEEQKKLKPNASVTPTPKPGS